jgi:hypothetical protein
MLSYRLNTRMCAFQCSMLRHHNLSFWLWVLRNWRNRIMCRDRFKLLQYGSVSPRFPMLWTWREWIMRNKRFDLLQYHSLPCGQSVLHNRWKWKVLHRYLKERKHVHYPKQPVAKIQFVLQNICSAMMARNVANVTKFLYFSCFPFFIYSLFLVLVLKSCAVSLF